VVIEKGSYNFSIGYLRDEAVVPGQNFTRYSFRGSLDHEVGKYFRLGFTTNNSYSVTNGNNMGLYGVLSMSPMISPTNADGTPRTVASMPQDDTWVYTKESVENLGDKWIDQTRAFGSYNNMYGEVKIPGVEGLKYRINLGGNFRLSNTGQYTGEGVFSNTATTPSTASVDQRLTFNWAVENIISYDRTFGKHQINAVALYSAEETKYNRTNISTKGIPVDAFQFYNLGSTVEEKVVNPDNQDYQLTGLTSYMGRVMYSFDNRYVKCYSTCRWFIKIGSWTQMAYLPCRITWLEYQE
jgi:hypothetical protein